jgi:hypothetical protein
VPARSRDLRTGLRSLRVGRFGDGAARPGSVDGGDGGKKTVSGAAAERREEGTEVVVVKDEHCLVIVVGGIEPASPGKEPASRHPACIIRHSARKLIFINIDKLISLHLTTKTQTFQKPFFSFL